MSHLEILLHERYVAVLAAHSVVQAALVVVFLRNEEATIPQGALHWRVFAVQHDVVVHVDAFIFPATASLAVRTLHHKLVQHVCNDLGHRA